jgi:hypothetical protein
MSDDSRHHKIRPMLAMGQDYHSKRCLTYGFSATSDLVRDQLISKGMDERQATIFAPQYLEGAIMAFNGDIDFRQIHYSLREEEARQKAEHASKSTRREC